MMFFALLSRIIVRNRKMLALSFGSLFIGALALGTVLGLIGSINQFFVLQSRELIGGDVTIERAQNIDPKKFPPLLELADKGATFTRRIETYVVAQSESTGVGGMPPSLLISLKVVDGAYPLYGKLAIAEDDVFELKADEVVVAPDLIPRMGLSVGDSLTIGSGVYRIKGTITNEPDRVAGSFRLGPVVIMSTFGWERSGVDVTRSRTSHTLSVRYPPSLSGDDRSVIESSINEIFKNSGARVTFASRGPTTLLAILDSAERFFFTMIVLTLFLVMVNIRINLVYFLSSFQKTIAIMRSVGMTRGELVRLFLSLLAILAVVAGVLGTILGNLLAREALPYAERIVGSPLPSPEILTSLPLVTIFILLLSFFSALSFFIRIAHIEPKLLLIGYSGTTGGRSRLRYDIPELLLTLVGLFVGIWYLTERVVVAGIAVGGIFVLFAILMFSTQWIIDGLHRIRFVLYPSVRYVVNFMKKGGVITITAVASVTIAIGSIFAITLIERNVIQNLRVDFRADAPNVYVLDIQEDQREGVRSLMNASWSDFAVVRGRFISRDGVLIQENLGKEDPELGREFNLTYRTDLIEGERVVGGVWHGESGVREVSVEKDFAARARIVLGSRLVFLVQGVPVEATVTSIREVTTTNGLPFFFLVYSPDVLEQIPKSYFGYAFVPDAEIPVLQNTLARSYPNISSIPTTQILETVSKVVSALTTAVIATTIPALILGVLLIIAMLALSARERANDMLVFSAFGARGKMIFTLFVVESLALVVFAGVFAFVIAHVGVLALNKYVFAFSGFYVSTLNFYLYASVLFATFLISGYVARRLVAKTPVELLRKYN